MSRHGSRQKLAREFGATDIVVECGDEGVKTIKELAGGIGADNVLECVVGAAQSMGPGPALHPPGRERRLRRRFPRRRRRRSGAVLPQVLSPFTAQEAVVRAPYTTNPAQVTRKAAYGTLYRTSSLQVGPECSRWASCPTTATR